MTSHIENNKEPLNLLNLNLQDEKILIQDLNIKYIEIYCLKCYLNNFEDCVNQCIYDYDTNKYICEYEDNIEELKKILLQKLYINGGISFYIKYIEKFNVRIDRTIWDISIIDNIYFNETLEYMKTNKIDIYETNLFGSMNKEQIQILINNNYDINYLYKSNTNAIHVDTTLIIDCVYKILNDKNNEQYKEIFDFLIEQKADIRKGNLLRHISGIQYDNRPYKIEFIQYLLDNNMIDIENKIIFKDKLLFDTRLGKCILNLIILKIESFNIHSCWHNLFIEHYYKLMKIINNINELRNIETIYPPNNLIFKVFEMDITNIDLVLLGQDPYINENQAMGLSFSVPKNVSIPPSLINIFKEIKNEFPDRNYNFEHGDLTKWSENGIFLLNSALTVIKSKSNSQQLLWSWFTDEVIKYINNNKCNIVLHYFYY